MKNKFKMLLLALMVLPTMMRANEGMWLVSLLNRVNEAEMKNLGLNLTAEEL